MKTLKIIFSTSMYRYFKKVFGTHLMLYTAISFGIATISLSLYANVDRQAKCITASEVARQQETSHRTATSVRRYIPEDELLGTWRMKEFEHYYTVTTNSELELPEPFNDDWEGQILVQGAKDFQFDPYVYLSYFERMAMFHTVSSLPKRESNSFPRMDIHLYPAYRADESSFHIYDENGKSVSYLGTIDARIEDYAIVIEKSSLTNGTEEITVEGSLRAPTVTFLAHTPTTISANSYGDAGPFNIDDICLYDNHTCLVTSQGANIMEDTNGTWEYINSEVKIDFVPPYMPESETITFGILDSIPNPTLMHREETTIGNQDYAKFANISPDILIRVEDTSTWYFTR